MLSRDGTSRSLWEKGKRNRLLLMPQKLNSMHCCFITCLCMCFPPLTFSKPFAFFRIKTLWRVSESWRLKVEALKRNPTAGSYAKYACVTLWLLQVMNQHGRREGSCVGPAESERRNFQMKSIIFLLKPKNGDIEFDFYIFLIGVLKKSDVLPAAVNLFWRPRRKRIPCPLSGPPRGGGGP